MNRHKKEMSVDIPHKTIQDLHRGNGWMVINGEYMNKSKKSSNETVFNKKFVIFDILVFNGRQTVGQTFKERVSLLEQNFTTKEYDGFINKHNEDIFIVKTFDKNFISLYQKLTEIDMYEGLVLKEVNAKLKNGISIKNNINSQIKVRKETKNYSF
jgi:hypothetical protein